MRRYATLLIFSGLVSGCVGKGKYEDALAQLAQKSSDYDALMATTNTEKDALRAQIAACENQLAAATLEITQGQANYAACQTDLSEARSLLSRSDAETQRLAARLQELSAVEAELRERDAIFQSILSRFQSLIDNGYLEVVVERGRLKLKLPQDILFDSGKAEINENGISALIQIGAVLATLEDREFQVEGHTDNVPISRSYDSNWELAAARALAVVHIFETAGVSQYNISAASFGEFQPRADNATDEGKALNRRIEIVMVPNVEAIFGDVAR